MTVDTVFENLLKKMESIPQEELDSRLKSLTHEVDFSPTIEEFLEIIKDS